MKKQLEREPMISATQEKRRQDEQQNEIKTTRINYEQKSMFNV